MKLANGETELKSWVYATSKQGLTKQQAEIKLTNKRLISSVESKRTASVVEVPLCEIKGFSFANDKASNLLAALKIILGIPLIAALGLGIFMIIDGVRSLNQGSFVMSVSVDGSPVDAAGVDTRRTVKSAARKIKVKLNSDISGEIADTLGALVINFKSGVAV